MLLKVDNFATLQYLVNMKQSALDDSPNKPQNTLKRHVGSTLALRLWRSANVDPTLIRHIPHVLYQMLYEGTLISG